MNTDMTGCHITKKKGEDDMPSDTFYRLPAEKRTRLTEAIVAELSRVPLSKMSINRIIQDAGIPRGSYYQYFSGPSDIVAYILTEFKEYSVRLAEKILQEAEGDFGALLEGLFEYTLKYGLCEERRDLFCNLFSEVRLGEIFSIFAGQKENCLGMIPEMDAKRRMVFEIMLAVFKESLVAAFAHAEHADVIAENFRGKIKMISKI